MTSLINPVDTLTRIEYHGLPVLTTEQLAKALSSPDKPVTVNHIKQNFSYNRDRYIESKHYFKLEGDELATFKNWVENSYSVSKNTRALYLWTERGCLYHCKSVNTDVAWEAYERLVDTYFNVKQILQDKPLPSIDDFKRAEAFTKLAAHADDPYMKKRLVVEAANLLFGHEEFTVPDCSPVVQLTLFK